VKLELDPVGRRVIVGTLVNLHLATLVSAEEAGILHWYEARRPDHGQVAG
jgi:hypothetical protein